MHLGRLHHWSEVSTKVGLCQREWCGRGGGGGGGGGVGGGGGGGGESSRAQQKACLYNYNVMCYYVCYLHSVLLLMCQ